MGYFTCGFCDSTIRYLDTQQRVREYSTYMLPEEPSSSDDRDQGEWGDIDDSDGEEDHDYFCPECSENIDRYNEEELVYNDSDEETEEQETTEEKPTRKKKIPEEETSQIIIPSGTEKFIDNTDIDNEPFVICKQDRTVVLVSEEEMEEETYVRCYTCLKRIDIKKIIKEKK